MFGFLHSKENMGQRMRKLYTLFLLLLLFSSQALGATYNIGPGNKYETFAVFHAAVTAQRGDIVDGGNNVFYERVVPNGPANYRNFTVDGRISLDGSLSSNPADTYNNVSPWVQVGATEIYSKSMSRCTYLFFEDGVLLTPIVTTDNNDVIANLARGGYTYNNSTMYYRATDGRAPVTHSLQGSSRSYDAVPGILYAAKINGLTLSNVTVRNHAPNSATSYSVVFDNCINLSLSAITITQNKGGLKFINNNRVIMDKNCSITHNRLGGIMLEGDSTNITIRGNISYNGRDKYYDISTYTYQMDGDGIGIGGSGGTMTGILITDATIFYNGAADGDQTPGDGNEFGAGIYLGTNNPMSVALVIKYCNIYENHTNGIYLGDQFTGGTIAYNIVRDNLKYTASDSRNAFHVDATNSVFTSLNIWNNIIARNYGNAGMYINNGSGKKISVRNNIFYNNGRTGTFLGDLWLQKADITGLTETNNLFHRSGTGWDAAIVIAKAETNWDKDHIVGTRTGFWQNDSGKGANDIFSDPLWVSVSGDNFNLLPISPARDTGANVGLTYDFQGNPVPSGSAPDIGAYEFNPGVSSGGGCSTSPEGKLKDESRLETMLALFSPGIFLVVRKTLQRDAVVKDFL